MWQRGACSCAGAIFGPLARTLLIGAAPLPLYLSLVEDYLLLMAAALIHVRMHTANGGGRYVGGWWCLKGRGEIRRHGQHRPTHVM